MATARNAPTRIVNWLTRPSLEKFQPSGPAGPWWGNDNQLKNII